MLIILFLATKKSTSTAQTKDQEVKLQKMESDKSTLTEKIKLLEEKLMKQESAVSSHLFIFLFLLKY